MPYWVRPDNSSYMHALSAEIPHGTETTAKALCGEEIHVPVRPWFVVIRFAPKDCPDCRVRVDEICGHPPREAKLEWNPHIRL
jgi:hypothetical protein